jgi:hypothetical protein
VAQPAAKADFYFRNATAHVISFTFLDGGIEEHREQKSLDTYDTCLAWKRQKEFLPPPPPAFLSFVYCERAEVRLDAKGTAVEFPPLGM